jgi:LmbE family N-acetylglucosaminyl deacetylase
MLRPSRAETMIFHRLSELSSAYEHIYLSPHLDDAALSCGGTIAHQRAAGAAVLVVTICTGAPPAQGPFSELAHSFHAAWGLSPGEAVAARLREDEKAMAALDVDALWVGELDAIYRHPAAYSSRESLFGAPAPDDPLLATVRRLAADLRARMPAATIYGPLGVGHHVDHQITYRAAVEAAGRPLAFYEDFPYVARPGELERRLADLARGLSPRVTVVDGQLERKLAAIGAYASQMAELAQSQLGRSVSYDEAMGVMAEAVTAYESLVGGERVWERPEA